MKVETHRAVCLQERCYIHIKELEFRFQLFVTKETSLGRVKHSCLLPLYQQLLLSRFSHV